MFGEDFKKLQDEVVSAGDKKNELKNNTDMETPYASGDDLASAGDEEVLHGITPIRTAAKKDTS